jgi:hypothetical protein
MVVGEEQDDEGAVYQDEPRDQRLRGPAARVSLLHLRSDCRVGNQNEGNYLSVFGSGSGSSISSESGSLPPEYLSSIYDQIRILIKEFKYINQKIISKLSDMIRNVRPGSGSRIRILIFTHPGSRI